MSTQIHGDGKNAWRASTPAMRSCRHSSRRRPSLMSRGPVSGLPSWFASSKWNGWSRHRLAAPGSMAEQMGVITRTPYQTAPPRFEDD